MTILYFLCGCLLGCVIIGLLEAITLFKIRKELEKTIKELSLIKNDIVIQDARIDVFFLRLFDIQKHLMSNKNGKTESSDTQ